MNVPITVMLPAASKYNIKCPFAMQGKGFCIHNTATNSTAMAEASYRVNNNYESSIHLFVDDERAVQCSPLDRNTWHAMDGGTGYANRNLWSLEICHSLGGGANIALTAAQKEKFLKAERNGAWIVAKVLHDHGLSANKTTIRWHYEFAATACPHRTKEYGLDRFIAMVQDYMAEISGAIPPAPDTPASPDGLTRVQVGAFKVKANAEALKRNAEAKGFVAIIKQVDGLYKVQLGAFKSEANAIAYMKQAKQAGFDAFLV